ncbi:uroporphyrinogen-III synthase [Candidatus Mesenet endosymbiont of Agriotes lineatus]|uniref:uroporphyrinogen-III synthase n=1 Tax=Candidatus Mesenet endosymbiont of Agriotes lineatus TaxID=3077948 RepID=UPI0030D1C6FA
MVLLLTRPLLDSKKTKSILEKYDYKVYVEPMFKIRYLETKLTQDFDVIISTSSNSIRALSKISQERSHSIITVGNGTMKVAKELGFTNVASASGNVSDLMLYIKEHYPQEIKFLYARGKEISFDFKKALTEKGFTVEETILYESIDRIRLTKRCKEFLLANFIRGVLFFSTRTAKIFCSLVEKSNLLDHIRNITAYSMSEKITGNLAHYRWKNIITSSQSTQESMLNCIVKYKKEH